MKHFDIDWSHFIRQLSWWSGLSPRSRKLLAELRGNEGMDASKLEGEPRHLASHGNLEYFAGGKRVRWSRQVKFFGTAIRAMARHDILGCDDPRMLFDYLMDHFTPLELHEAFRKVLRQYGEHYYDHARPGIAGKIATRACSTQWVEQFLAESAPKSDSTASQAIFPLWRRQARWPSSQNADPGLVHKLVRRMMEFPEPQPLVELAARWNDIPPDALGAAIRRGIELLVLFPFVRLADLTPMLGLWPAIHRRLHRPKCVVPSEVQPREVFHYAWLVEDMATVLAAAASRPLRLRHDGLNLFSKAHRELSEALLPMPDWAAKTLERSPDARLHEAIAWAGILELVWHAGTRGEDLRLEVTGKGEEWLGETGKRRLQLVLDAFRPPPPDSVRNSPPARESDDDADDAHDDYHAEPVIPFLPLTVRVPRRNPKKVEAVLQREVVAAFGALPQDRFVDLDEFLAWRAQEANPLPVIMRGKASSPSRNPHAFFEQPTIETLEAIWSRLLKEMLRQRLAPLGVAPWGWDEDGGRVCFAMTGMGRYLLGLADDFEYTLGEAAPGQLVVQPNFDVVFLKASPPAEVSVARFAERKGRGVGTLFTITKKSIFAAAGSGMTAAQVLDTLQRLSAKPLPANVAREISGWFDQCRRIRIEPAVLIHCPDADTALRVIAASRNQVKALTDTVVELTEPQSKTELVRKLRAAGIFTEREPAKDELRVR